MNKWKITSIDKAPLVKETEKREVITQHQDKKISQSSNSGTELHDDKKEEENDSIFVRDDVNTSFVELMTHKIEEIEELVNEGYWNQILEDINDIDYVDDDGFEV